MKSSKKKHTNMSHTHTTKKSSGNEKSHIKRDESGSEEKLKKVLEPKKSKFPYLPAALMLIAIIAVILIISFAKPDGSESTEDKAKVEFYVMSQCPYGTQVENAIYPLFEKMGDVIDFHLDYIVSESTPGTFQSLHGEPEVVGNKVQLCAAKYYAKDYKYMDFIICQNENAATVNTNWEACADKNDMDKEKLRTCLEGEESNSLLRESMGKSQERNAQGSPTIFIGDQAYTGGRDAVSFQRAICQFTEHESCSEIPECSADTDCTAEADKIGICANPGKEDAKCTYQDPVAVQITVLTSEKCGAACDTTRIMQVNKQLFKGAQVRYVDVESAEGKAIAEKNNLEVVPVYLFDEKLTETFTWKNVDGIDTAFQKTADGYRLLDQVTGSTYFVSDEARAEYYKAIGVTIGDNKPQIDFFVMSYCPYGNQAEEGIEPVYQLLKDKADFNPRYVIYSNYGGGGPNYCLEGDVLCSMHGIQELHQNIRETCVNKYMGIDKWFEFALAMNDKCTYKNADTCWEAVAKDLGLDVAKIKTCEANEGEALMTADKAIGDKLSVSGSPSVFIDGEKYAGGRTPEEYKTGLCEAFDDAPAECNTKLAGAEETKTAAPPAGACG